jgi:hypothetical protein
MLAVLEDSVGHYYKYAFARDCKGRMLFNFEVDWITNPDLADPFSFESICLALQLEPDYIRGGLEKWRQAILTNVAQGERPPQIRMAYHRGADGNRTRVSAKKVRKSHRPLPIL